MTREIIWSNGLGTQSTAIAVLIAQGKLPKPAYAISADTSRELKKVWDYSHTYTFPLLESLGVKVEIVPHTYANVDLYSGKNELLIPAFLKNGTGKLSTFCSGEWKRRVVMRRLRELGYGPNNKIVLWMGMSRDEIARMKTSDVDWMSHYYPLALDLRMSRYDCQKVVLDYGWPEPPRSRCAECPHQQNPEWREVRESPDEWQRAIQVDHQITESHGVYLHYSGVPLEEAAIDDDPKPNLFDGCDTGICEF